MTTLGRVALRDFAMLRQHYPDTGWDASRPGWVPPGLSVFPDALTIMEEAHKQPTSGSNLYLPTGMLVPFTPEIATFTPGDEDVGSYANAFDQTITSRMASCTFSTDGMSYEDMKELCHCFGNIYTGGSARKFTTGGEDLVIPQQSGIADPFTENALTVRQSMGKTDGFQTWSFLWQDGLEQANYNPTENSYPQIYVMPLAFVTNVRIQAGIRREVGMTASAVAREVIEVCNRRDWGFKTARTRELSDFYSDTYPFTPEIYNGVPFGSITPQNQSRDTGIDFYGTDSRKPREVKNRFIAAGIEIYLDPTGMVEGSVQANDIISSDNVAMTIDLSTGLNPSWRFGDLSFRQGIRARRGMMLSLDFVNDNKGRGQFRRFLSQRRKVQKIWIAFHDQERKHRMVIESYIRNVNIGQLPSDDGQWADVFPLMYQSVGVKPTGIDSEQYLLDDESDFAIHFATRASA